MGIRAKLTIPIVLAFIVFAGILHYYWAPGQYQLAQKTFVSQMKKELSMLDAGLISPLLSQDYALLTSIMNEQAKFNHDIWNNLMLFDKNGQRIYPFIIVKNSLKQNVKGILLRHAIYYEQNLIGEIQVHVNWMSQYAMAKEKIITLEWFLLSIAFLLLSFSLYWQTKIIRAPLLHLTKAINSMSSDDLNHLVPKASHDEMGQLTRAFNTMQLSLAKKRVKLIEADKKIQATLNELREKNTTLQQEVVMRKQAQAKLAKMALYDDLTQLPNRVLHKKQSKKELALAQRNHHKVGFMFVDLDGFKAINDRNGHDIGDLVLIEIARRLERVVREEDMVCRFGGDEFLITLPDCGEREASEEVAKRILYTAQQPFDFLDSEQSISASIGLALYPDDADNYIDLIVFADSAMYEAKRAGKNTYVLISNNV